MTALVKQKISVHFLYPGRFVGDEEVILENSGEQVVVHAYDYVSTGLPFLHYCQVHNLTDTSSLPLLNLYSVLFLKYRENHRGSTPFGKERV